MKMYKQCFMILGIVIIHLVGRTPTPAVALIEDAKVHYDRGYKFIDEKKFDDAEKELLEAIKIDPDYAEGHLELGVVYLNKGNGDKATIEFRKAARLNPKNYVGLRNLGTVYYQRGLKTLAVKQYEQALALEPKYADAHHDLAYIYFNIGETTAWNKEILDKTIYHLETYQTLVPAAAEVPQNKLFIEQLKKKRDNIGSLTVMTVPESRKDVDKLKFSEDTIQRMKDRINGKTDLQREIDERSALMLDLLQRGEKDEALYESEDLLTIDPKNKKGLLISATILYKNKSYDQAIKQAEKAIDLFPNPDEDMVIAYDLLARLYYKIGNQLKSDEYMAKLKTMDRKMAADLEEKIRKDSLKQ